MPKFKVVVQQTASAKGGVLDNLANDNFEIEREELEVVDV